MKTKKIPVKRNNYMSETTEILSDSKIMKSLVKSLDDIKRGRTYPIDGGEMKKDNTNKKKINRQVFGSLKEWKTDSQKLKDELREELSK